MELEVETRFLAPEKWYQAYPPAKTRPPPARPPTRAPLEELAGAEVGVVWLGLGMPVDWNCFCVVGRIWGVRRERRRAERAAVLVASMMGAVGVVGGVWGEKLRTLRRYEFSRLEVRFN
ncbi:uncharacterized protein BDZ99DRAFT_179560 [Mytilinidion resinicola]|uniref:Uncharacterized protein n=1 Tax=Mytilinidion resinicola TaxID=574789 RepID=A0A6A6Y3D7_9PEZI|nr:uncharacterized protein BDZ99DRAFT_179560 [Mytilinidion resinicola]KAF2803038.1 hypothetical protein BDZ99DRAFT_179560 [Mytilinidion resinicola]